MATAVAEAAAISSTYPSCSSFICRRAPSILFSFQHLALPFRRQFCTFSLLSSFSSRTCRVSTSPIDQASPLGFDYEKEIARLDSLRSRLRDVSTLRAKLQVLEAEARVGDFFGSGRVLSSLDLSMEFQFLIKCLVAAGQGHVLVSELNGGGRRVAGNSLKEAFYMLADMIKTWNFDGVGEADGGNDAVSLPLRRLLKTLDEVEKFYDCIGGIIGYQVVVLQHLSTLASKGESTWSSHLNESLTNQLQEFHVPAGVDLLENTEYASQAALWGIEGLPELGEIYPLGGAGDRLGLVDPITGECLPAAMLPYNGRTLLEGLVRDLQVEA